MLQGMAGGMKMQSPLIRSAKRNAKLEALQNYIIAGAAGAILGAMLALSI